MVRLEAERPHLPPATSRDDLPAELIGLIDRQRWTIELFFKWMQGGFLG